MAVIFEEEPIHDPLAERVQFASVHKAQSGLIYFLISKRLVKDQQQANIVLISISAVFIIAALIAWPILSTPKAKHPETVIYKEQVTSAMLDLIPPDQRQAYMDSLPSINGN